MTDDAEAFGSILEALADAKRHQSLDPSKLDEVAASP